MNTEPPSSSHRPIEPIFACNAIATDKSTGQAAKGIVSGLSLDGCLFQSPRAFSVATLLRLEFSLYGHHLEISAIVRQVSPSGSIQLEFFALDSAESLLHLQRLTASPQVSRHPEE